MVKYKSHLIAMAIDTTDAAAKGRHQVIQSAKQHVGQNGAFQVAPQTFDQVQVRTIRRQPENPKPVAMIRQIRFHGFGVMKAGVVAHQANLATRIGFQQNRQKGDKVPSALGVGHRMDNAAGGVIHTPVHDHFGVLSGRRNFGLASSPGPQPIQRRKPMQLGFILENQRFVRVVFRGVFFKRDSCLRAFSQAASSRLPLRVCLGRRKEKPS